MLPKLRPAVALGAVAAALLAVYVVLWAGVSQAHIGGSDFTATYVGATLLRQGHGAAIYNDALQTALHSSLIAPQRGGNLAFVSPPSAAVLALPLTLLPLSTAYRVSQAAQLLMLLLGVVIAARAAPWPVAIPRRVVVTAVVIALAGTGTLALGLLGQWDGLGALGLGAAYMLWRRDARFAGGAVLALTAAVAKPHLALCLAGFLIGWRDRRALAGAMTGVAAALIVSVAAVGTTGLGGFLAAVGADAGRWPLASMLGFTGLTGSWLGDGVTAQALAAVGSVVAVAASILVGMRLRGDRRLVEPCLAAATALSLLASPHMLSQDLVLLAPVLVALLAWTATRDGAATGWPGPSDRTVLAAWLAICLAAALDLGSQQPAPPGRLTPWVLGGSAGALVWALRPGRRTVRQPAGRLSSRRAS